MNQLKPQRNVLLKIQANNMDIKKLSIQELKAFAYDQLVLIEQGQANIKIINAEIAERNKPMSEEITEEVVVEEATAEEVAAPEAE